MASWTSLPAPTSSPPSPWRWAKASGTSSGGRRNPKEEILGRRQWITITLHSLVMTAAAFSALGLTHLAGLDGRATVTTTFLTVAFAQPWHVFNMRGTGSRLFVNEVTRNPWVWAALALPPYWPPATEVWYLVPPTATMWAIVMASSLSSLLLIQTAMIGLDMAWRWRAKAQ